MKKIYIVLTYTGTILANIVRFYTKDEFTHVSIALDEELNEMYSFGRLNPYNPFIGGFIHEYISSGTFKRFKNTKAKICSLEITNEQYSNIKENISRMQKNKNNYKFNVLGLFAVAIHKKVQPKNSFYCAEFVKYAMQTSNIKVELPELITPQSFENINGLIEIYKGFLKEYNSPKRALTSKVPILNNGYLKV